MANAVYRVDGETRLVLPATSWSHSVIGSLITQGHEVRKSTDSVELTEQDRSQEELDRRDILLAKSGY